MSTDNGHLVAFQTGKDSIDLDSYREYIYSPFSTDEPVSDFVLHTDITWESEGPYAVCGVLFRSEEDFEKGEQYQFAMIRLGGFPKWDIEYHKDGYWVRTITKYILDSSAIEGDQGSTNSVVIVAEGEKISIWINGERVRTQVDRTLAEGLIAFFAWQDSGTTSCAFENSWLWSLDSEDTSN
jgi:hypothetical protein